MYLGVLHIEHWRVGLLFLKAGKNVLCEKPFAMNSRQVKDLVEEAKKNNVFLMEVRQIFTQNPTTRKHQRCALKICLQQW